MKRIFFIGLFLSVPFLVKAAFFNDGDSLKQMLDTAKGKSRISLLIRLSEQNRNTSVYDCKRYFQQAFDLAKSQNDLDQLGLASKSMGVSYFYWGDMKNAFRFFKQGLSYYRKSQNKEGESNCLNNLGLVYEGWARFDSAAFYYKASYLIEKELKNKEGAATSLINMGNIAYYRKNYHDALQDYFRALKLFVEVNDQNGIAMSYNSIAIIYSHIGEFDKALDYLNKAKSIYAKTHASRKLSRVLNNMADIYGDHFKKYKKAEILYETVLKIKKELDDKEGIALVKCNLGVLYGHMGILQQALRFFDESEQLFRQINDKWGLSMVYLNKGKVLLNANRFKPARDEFLKSLAISEKVRLNDFTNSNYEGLFKCYAALGDYEHFNQYYQLFEQSRDSLTRKLEDIRIAELEARFKIDSLVKQRNNLLQDTRQKALKIKKFYLLSLGLSLLVVVLVLAFFLYRKAKKEAEKYRPEG